MSGRVNRPRWILVAVIAAAVVAGWALGSGGFEAGGSSLSQGGGGWMAARLYVEAQGTPTRLLRVPLGDALDLSRAARGVPRPTLVLVFPWQSRPLDVDPAAVLAHLGAGGDLLLGYSGELTPTPAEEQLLDVLGASPERLQVQPPPPWRWRAGWTWRLRPARRWADGPDGLQMRRRRWLPRPPDGSALLLGLDEWPVVAAWRVGAGRVALLPAELLCNARLGTAAHGDLLESLRGWLRGGWEFDEYHHGLGEVAGGLPPATRLGFDLLLGQLALLYLLAALALGRRLGPAWRERPPLVGSAASFLLRLGSLHHRLGHHRAGAELMLRRAGELDRRFVAGEDLSGLAASADAEALVEVGRRVAIRQRWRNRP